ncbi:hypothetical protein BKA80DRAFT_269714 [Phyllosticta citrichinensis]
MSRRDDLTICYTAPPSQPSDPRKARIHSAPPGCGPLGYYSIFRSTLKSRPSIRKTLC